MIEPRNVADIIFVFLLVYAVLKLLRGTRAAPMAAGIAFLVFLYWLSVKQDLATLEFVLSNGLLYIGIAIIVLFQSEIRQALISFGNRFRVPFSRHRGQFGEGVYDEVILAATTAAPNNEEGKEDTAVGFCRFGDPTKKGMMVECMAHTPAGLYEAVFLADGAPPKLGEFPVSR